MFGLNRIEKILKTGIDKGNKNAEIQDFKIVIYTDRNNCASSFIC
jgi:hypothetical protein